MNQPRQKNGQFAGKINGEVGLPDTPRGPWSESAQRFIANQLIENVTTIRSQLMRRESDPRRSIDDDCGYPKDTTIDHYRRMYDRETIARRVVEVLPQESWLVQPTVFEVEDIETETEFEIGWRDFSRSLATQSAKSWFSQEEGSPVWEHLRRVDELSGIGSYGILLIGLDDGLELRKEALPRKKQRVTFIRAFDEALVTVARFDENIRSSRFGKPLAYNVLFSDPFHEQSQSEIVVIEPSLTETEVHWTRCIHIADNLGSSEVFGTPRMQVPFNRLSDLRKLYGGSAEMYWRGAFPGLAFTSHPQLGTAPFMDDKAKAEMRDQMEQYMNTIQRYITAQGFEVTSLAPQVVDPTPQIDAAIKAICIQIGVPKRVFEGSERGELASTQDAKVWATRLKNRQNIYLTPRVIVPFIDRLIWLMVLPEPKLGYNVEWPDLESLTEEEKAKVAQLRMDAASKYVQGGVDSIMIPVDFFTRVMSMSQDEAIEVVQSAMHAVPGEDVPEKEEEDDPETKSNSPGNKATVSGDSK